MKCSLAIPNFLEQISSFPIYCFPLFLCINHWSWLTNLYWVFKGCASHCSGLITFIKIFSPQSNGSSCHSLDEDSRLRAVWHTKTTVQEWQSRNSCPAAPTSSCSRHWGYCFPTRSPRRAISHWPLLSCPFPRSPGGPLSFGKTASSHCRHLILDRFARKFLGFDFYPTCPLSPHCIPMMLRQMTSVRPGHLLPSSPSFLP